uniref:Uncharacterized protein n=1 Tax=Rattus norvegicus TaxID=10116 RepID=A0A8I6AJY9_RAT
PSSGWGSYSCVPPCPMDVPCMRTVGEPCMRMPCMRTVGEPCMRMVGEPCMRTVGEPCMRTVGEPCMRKVGEPCMRTVGKPCMRTVGELRMCLLFTCLLSFLPALKFFSFKDTWKKVNYYLFYDT